MKNSRVTKIFFAVSFLLFGYNCHAALTQAQKDILNYVNQLQQQLELPQYKYNPAERYRLEQQIAAYKRLLPADAQTQARQGIIGMPQQPRVQPQAPTPTVAPSTAGKVTVADATKPFPLPTGGQWTTREPAAMNPPAGQRGGGDWSRAYRNSFIKFVNADKSAITWEIYLNNQLAEKWTQGPRSKHWYKIPTNRCVTKIVAGSAVYNRDLCGTGFSLPQTSDSGYPGYRAKYRGRGRLNVQQVRH